MSVSWDPSTHTYRPHTDTSFTSSMCDFLFCCVLFCPVPGVFVAISNVVVSILWWFLQSLIFNELNVVCFLLNWKQNHDWGKRKNKTWAHMNDTTMMLAFAHFLSLWLDGLFRLNLVKYLRVFFIPFFTIFLFFFSFYLPCLSFYVWTNRICTTTTHTLWMKKWTNRREPGSDAEFD